MRAILDNDTETTRTKVYVLTDARRAFDGLDAAIAGLNRPTDEDYYGVTADETTPRYRLNLDDPYATPAPIGRPRPVRSTFRMTAAPAYG